MSATVTLAAPPPAAPAAKSTGVFVKSLDYLGLEVSNLAAWTRFAQEVLGLQALPGSTPQTTLLRMDSRPYRIVLTQGPADDIVFAGWRVDDAAALDAYARHLDKLGRSYVWASPGELALRGVDRMLQIRDPNGVVHEASVGAADAAAFTPQVTKGGFVTGKGGLGHIVFGSTDYAGSVAFAQDALGAGVSDIIEQKITETLSAHVTFMHVNERHHSIAFAGRSGAKKLHHFMIEVERVDDVGRARDRHIKAGLPIVQDIGQHPNDQMISYYGATPSGFFVEFGWGGVKVDIPTWTPGAYDRMSEWGHRPLASTPLPSSSPAPKAKEIAVSVTGNWTLKIVTPMGETPADLTLEDDLSGEITSMGAPANVYDGALKDAALSFKADVTKPFPMTLAFALTVTGDAVSGEVQAGALGASPVSGVRA